MYFQSGCFFVELLILTVLAMEPLNSPDWILFLLIIKQQGHSRRMTLQLILYKLFSQTRPMMSLLTYSSSCSNFRSAMSLSARA